MGFSNRAQRFTGFNYLDVDSPLSPLLFVKLSNCVAYLGSIFSIS